MRRVEEDEILGVASGARSAKKAQMRHNPAVAVVLWLPAAREQLRLEGTAEILATGGDDPR